LWYNPQYQFADAFAPELQQNPSAVPLADFFSLTSPRTFVAITSTESSLDGETVTFSSGKSILGKGETKNGVAAVSTVFAKAGTFTIKASYAGDAFRSKSTGTVKQVVNN
jgi:aspartate carbamoyltransferase catalytic subunit